MAANGVQERQCNEELRQQEFRAAPASPQLGTDSSQALLAQCWSSVFPTTHTESEATLTRYHVTSIGFCKAMSPNTTIISGRVRNSTYLLGELNLTHSTNENHITILLHSHPSYIYFFLLKFTFCCCCCICNLCSLKEPAVASRLGPRVPTPLPLQGQMP